MDRKMNLTGKTMKTSRIIFMLALAAAATACNKAELEGTDPAGLKSNQFLASLEGASTKVTMANDFSLSWVAGDQVSVFGEDLKNNLFTADASGEEVALNGGDVTVDPEATYYAIYPYSEKNSIVAGGVITTEIPTVQTPKQGDIPVNFAVARNDGQKFTFYNVCGLVGFEITEDNIVSVTVKANGTEEYLTGKINVTPSTAPSYEVVEGVSEVTLVTDGVFEKGYHYVAVLPQAFEDGITVLMAKEDGTVATKTTTKSFTLNRSHRIDTKQIDADQSWTKLTSISNAAELQAFLAAADNYAAADVVTLAADIDLKGYDIVPAASFAGTFDGAGKSIKNWNTTTALFNEVSGTVKNLTIAESCNLEVQVKGDAAFIALSNTGTISGCNNYGAVTSVNEAFVPDVAEVYNDRAIGTIAAVSTGSIVLCENHGTVTITPASVGRFALQFIGGVAGKASATADVNALESCTNNGAVTFDGPFSSKLFIGGVCGGTPAGAGTFGDHGVFKTLKNVADVTLTVPTASSIASTYINLGGVIGYAEADLDDCDNEGAVTVDVPTDPAAQNYNMQRPAIAGVAGAGLYNVTNCDNTGDLTVTGAFSSTSGGNAGDGKSGEASFGGVVATAGSNASSHKVTSCTNSGKITLNIDMFNTTKSHGNIGGVIGHAMAQIYSCTASGDGMIIKNKMRGARVGGVVGLVKAKVVDCKNSAPIDYDMVITEKNENQAEYIYLGGLIGHLDSGAATALEGSDNSGNITVRNGYNSGVPCSIGGLVGKNQYGIIAGVSSKSNILGTYTVNSPSMIYFGGIVGYSAAESTTAAKKGKSLGMKYFQRRGTTVITNPGEGSRIGGICGVRVGAIANDDCGTDNNVNLVANDGNGFSFVVQCQSQIQDVYAGLFYGQLSVYEGAAYAIRSCVMNTSSFAGDENLTGSGLAVGYLVSGNVQFGDDNGQYKVRQINFRGTDISDGTNLTGDLLVGGKEAEATVTVTDAIVKYKG